MQAIPSTAVAAFNDYVFTIQKVTIEVMCLPCTWVVPSKPTGSNAKGAKYFCRCPAPNAIITKKQVGCSSEARNTRSSMELQTNSWFDDRQSLGAATTAN
jgi:hypothetical protein